jgi:hypothetical protein
MLEVVEHEQRPAVGGEHVERALFDTQPGDDGVSDASRVDVGQLDEALASARVAKPRSSRSEVPSHRRTRNLAMTAFDVPPAPLATTVAV